MLSAMGMESLSAISGMRSQIYTFAIPGLGHHRAVHPGAVGRILQGVFDALESKNLSVNS